MANVSELLRNTIDDHFLAQITLTAPEDIKLRDARTKIRAHLRKTFKQLDPQRIGGKAVSPRFYTQGSYAYGTLNRPAVVPPQQMDMDDGAYLPMSFVQKTSRPSVAAQAFFEIIDASLKVLADAENWTFTSKPTCSRLILDARAHVDVPLYAIPDDEYELLAKAAQQIGVMSQEGMVFAEALRSKTNDNWTRLPSDKVLLAHRDQDWIVSDPRKINDWFLDRVEFHGEQLRRVCRYLKAWRDYNHPELNEVTSILLMACVAAVYDERPENQPMPDRDDLAFLEVAKRLPAQLSGHTKNPTDPLERLDRRLDAEGERKKAVRQANLLATRLASLLEHCFDAYAAVEGLQQLLGDRVPVRPDLVRVEAPTRQTVLAQPRSVVAAPIVGRSISG